MLGIFLHFKISCSGIRKIAQRLKCLLCNPEQLELIQRGRKRTYTTELPTGLHMCSMAILLLTLFIIYTKITIKNKFEKNSCSGYIQWKKHRTLSVLQQISFSLEVLLASMFWRTGSVIAERQAWLLEVVHPPPLVQGLEEWQRDGFKQ